MIVSVQPRPCAQFDTRATNASADKDDCESYCCCCRNCNGSSCSNYAGSGCDVCGVCDVCDVCDICNGCSSSNCDDASGPVIILCGAVLISACLASAIINLFAPKNPKRSDQT